MVSNDHGLPPFSKRLVKGPCANGWNALPKGKNSSELLASSFFQFFLSCSASTDFSPKLAIFLSVPGYITPRSMVANQLFSWSCNRLFRLHLRFSVKEMDVSGSMETYTRWWFQMFFIFILSWGNSHFD